MTGPQNTDALKSALSRLAHLWTSMGHEERPLVVITIPPGGEQFVFCSNLDSEATKRFVKLFVEDELPIMHSPVEQPS